MTLLTEEEAKTKRCPVSFPAADSLSRDGATFGSDFEAMKPSYDKMTSAIFTAPSHCIGSACMAWRTGVWDHQRNLKPEDRTPGVGYCGAFGRPT